MLLAVGRREQLRDAEVGDRGLEAGAGGRGRRPGAGVGNGSGGRKRACPDRIAFCVVTPATATTTATTSRGYRGTVDFP
jgi:hypothetical protein